jgi:ketosteroid isomerase-like protein
MPAMQRILAQPISRAALKRAVDRLNRGYAAAYNRGRLDRVLDFFAGDAVTLPPDGKPVRGRAALRRHLREAFRREGRRCLALVSLRRESSGGVLCDGGRWRNSVRSPDGKSVSTSGYYLTAYRRSGGTWKAAITTFNLLRAPAPRRGRRGGAARP